MSTRTRVEDRITTVGAGPARVTLDSQGQRTTLNAELAAGCLAGDEATLELRDGALGQPWVSALRCPKAR